MGIRRVRRFYVSGFRFHEPGFTPAPERGVATESQLGEYVPRLVRGFTIVEVLVAVAITSLLASILILYSGTSRAQVTLMVERAKVVQVVLRAKSLAIETYASRPGLCGYGVRLLNQTTYQLISYASPLGTAGCAGIVSINDGNAQVLDTFVLTTGLSFGIGPSALEWSKNDAIFFLPPDPKSLIWIGGIKQGDAASGVIYLKSSDGAIIKVTVGAGGQVSY